MSQEHEIARAEQVQARYTEDLINRAHVQGTAVGLAKVGGQLTDTVAVVVLVDHKVPESELAQEDICPKEIEGVRVDVQEVGVLRAY
jgi:hypothetical protein